MEVEQAKTARDPEVKRLKHEQTTAAATAATEAERWARLEKTMRLRAAREAQDTGAKA